MNISEGGGSPPGKGPFTEGELAEVAAEPAQDVELEEVEAANIDEPESAQVPEKAPVRGRRLSAERARTVVESLLLVADRPLSIDQLQQTTGLARDVLTRALEQISGAFREGVSGIVLHEVAGGWQLRTDPGSAEDVRRFLQIKPQRLTRAALETLAIIAYRQPVTRPDVEDVRGVDSGAVIKALLERKLIRILGRKEEIGRPILYGTSREFLEFFSLRDLGSLPTLREFQELSREHQEIVERETTGPAAPVPTLASLADPTFRGTLESTQEEAEEA
ncbi:MAG TPA: SMC-Scp complex subunit ScpB, partial [Myxococcaceae bacterium]|nr:SMC-Scp complex subunit ScpB [Myxococcaceae bacterium]